MTKCVICEQRPANGGGFCVQCGNRIDAERKAKAKNEPRYFLTYRGEVVGLFPNGGKVLRARLLRRSAEKLPKGKTVNLDHYCVGYSRDIIKRFKSCVLHLSHA
ncbi:hypothetical protein KKE60_04460 [Patescibacteria group bacterium]|nr:hypothetical protein [Patescibacteria group bacterium]